MKLDRCRIDTLTPRDWDRIWAFASRYTETPRAALEAALRKRQHLQVAFDRGELVGMAAVDVAALEFEGETIVRIFTANTLIAESHRGHNLIQRWAIGALARVRARYPLAPIYWFFDTFSYRSYLLLPRNFQEYWPRRDVATPPRIRRLMDAIARPLYGEAWDPARGIVRNTTGKKLKAFVAPIDERARATAEVRFFEAQNPRHAEGEMLACLAPLGLRNCATIAARGVARALRARRASGEHPPLRPQRGVDEPEHHGDLDQRPDHRRERDAAVDAEGGDRDSDRELEVVRGGGEAQRGAPLVVRAHALAEQE